METSGLYVRFFIYARGCGFRLCFRCHNLKRKQIGWLINRASGRQRLSVQGIDHLEVGDARQENPLEFCKFLGI